jgi:hypothetical protein
VTGRHRANGRHRKPVQSHPGRRLAIVCGCALCAAVIPLFAQHAPSPTAGPDLVSAPAAAPLQIVPVPPAFTIQPRVDTVDMVAAVSGELAKHHDKGDNKPKDTSSDDTSSSSDTDPSSSDDSTPSSGDTGHHPHKGNPDYHQTVPPVPPNCQ